MEKLSSKEQQLAKKYLDVTNTMMIALDTKGKVTLANKKASEVLGYTKAEIVGKDWFEQFLPRQIGEDVRLVAEKIFSGERESVEYYENPVLTKGGKERLISWHNATVVEDGKIIGLISSGIDITEKKKSAENFD